MIEWCSEVHVSSAQGKLRLARAVDSCREKLLISYSSPDGDKKEKVLLAFHVSELLLGGFQES